MLEAFFVREFKALKAADPTVATLEATDASGVVIIRGHNPAKKGDDKGKLPQIKMALAGQAAGGLTVSPTSGEAAEDSVLPVRADDVVVGTLKVGSYFKAATAEELQKKTGLEVMFVVAGKVTETTFPRDVNPPAPADLIKLAQSGAPASLEADIKGTQFSGRFIHLPSDNGEGMTIGFFANRSPIEVAKSGFLSSLLLEGRAGPRRHLAGRSVVRALGDAPASASRRRNDADCRQRSRRHRALRKARRRDRRDGKDHRGVQGQRHRANPT